MQDHGCVHYKRHCEIKAPCCNTFHVCRKCHDSAVSDGHEMDRYIVKEMRCLFCLTEQPISNQCIQCQSLMANYYCDICHFFDDNREKDIWHCGSCGLCRAVMKNEKRLEHCFSCHSCMPSEHTVHIDVDNNCAICMESTLKGYKPCILPGPCEHILHDQCYNEYRKQGKYKCPTCSKTYATVNAASIWALYDREIQLQPMPEEYKDIQVSFLCNDCNVKEISTLNLIGYKCSQCGGYNTVRQ